MCAHALMLALEGIPAFYVHSLLGTRNDHTRVEHTGHNRSINRSQLQYPELELSLGDEQGHHKQVFDRLRHLIGLRRLQPAFHPNATQFTLQMGAGMFGFWRQSMDRRQSVFCIFNVTNEPVDLSLSDINLVLTDEWHDLITGAKYPEGNEMVVVQPYQALWITNYTVA